MMKRLLAFLLFASAPACAQLDTVRISDTPNRGRIRINQAINRIAPVWNVRQAPFNAVGDGVTNDSLAIRRAVDSVNENGGILYIPKGTYMVGPYPHPMNGAIEIVFALKSGTTVAGDGVGQSIIKIRDNSGDVTRVMMNYNPDTGVDSNIVIRDLTLDANGYNNPQTANYCQHGIYMIYVKNLLVENVMVRDVRGTNSGPPGESFHFEANGCVGATFKNCVAEGDTFSSSGFSADGSTFVTWDNCRAYGFGRASGFTHYGCSNLSYVSCYAYSNPTYAGFNSEVSKEVSYVQCTAGGYSPAYGSKPTYDSAAAYSNTHGFVVEGNTGPIVFTGCVARGNLVNGINSGSGVDILINGGLFENNGLGGSGYGIALHNTSDTANLIVTGAPLLRNNASGPLSLHGTGYSNSDYNAGDPVLWRNKGAGKFLMSNALGVGAWTSYPTTLSYTVSSGDGWYRLIQDSSSGDYVSGWIRLYGSLGGSARTAIWFYVAQNRYNGSGSINIISNLDYVGTHIDSIRTGSECFGGVQWAACVDIKLSGVVSTPTLYMQYAGSMDTLGALISGVSAPDSMGALISGRQYGLDNGAESGSLYPYWNVGKGVRFSDGTLQTTAATGGGGSGVTETVAAGYGIDVANVGDTVFTVSADTSELATPGDLLGKLSIADAVVDSSTDGNMVANSGNVIVNVTMGAGVTYTAATRTLTAGAGTATNDTLGLVNIMNYGAVPDSSTNASTAIQTAADFARDNRKTLWIPAGTFKLNTGVTFACAVMADPRAKFVTTDTSIVLVTFNSGADANYDRNNIRVDVPHLQLVGHAEGVWPVDSTASIGFKVIEARKVMFTLGTIQGFTVGVKLGGAGVVGYNDFYRGFMLNNRLGVWLTHDDNAAYWTNGNTFYGTRWAYTGSNNTNNAVHYFIDYQATNPLDGNNIVKGFLENNANHYAAVVGGPYNDIDARWECSDGLPKVKLLTGGFYGNQFRGIWADQIVFTATGTDEEYHENARWSRAGIAIKGGGTANSAPFTGGNASADTKPTFAVIPKALTINAGSDTAYTFGAGSTYTAGKLTGDAVTAPKWRFDNSTGVLWLNSNTTPSAPATGILLYVVSGGANADTLRAIDHLGNIKTLKP